MFSAGVSNIKVTSALSANPVAIGFDIAKGVAKAKREQEVRDQVAKTQGLTGFEVFGTDYKQAKVGDNMSDNGFFTNLTRGFTSTLGDVASTLAGIAGPANQIAGFFGSDTPIIGPTNRNPSVTNTVPRENKDTGTVAGNNIILGGQGMTTPNQAFIGGLPNLIGTASRLLRSPTAVTGVGGGAIGAFLGQGSAQSTPRITRRMRSEVRRLLMLTGGNYSIVSQFMNQSGKYPRINFTPELLMAILIKRFRNDGSFVTKAAVRKTRSTIRKLKSMSNLLKEVSTTRTRRTTRRMSTGSTTLIKN